MSITFTKLFSSITESTIWCESSEIRIVWITMLAMSDKEGRIWGSIPGLANRAQVSIEAIKSALEKFQSPDKYSRTTDFEGRRIEPIDGGWRLLNHGKYRAIRDVEERKAYKRNWIKDKREKDKNVDNVDRGGPQYTHTDTDTEADTNQNTLSGKPDRSQAKEILTFLNDKTGRRYEPVEANLKLIKARLKEYGPDKLRQMIALKSRKWLNDDDMSQYLRPATLFNATKCAQYIGELDG